MATMKMPCAVGSGGEVGEVKVTIFSNDTSMTQNNANKIFDVKGVNTLHLIYTANNTTGGCKVKDSDGNVLYSLTTQSSAKTEDIDISNTDTISIGNYLSGSWTCSLKEGTYVSNT